MGSEVIEVIKHGLKDARHELISANRQIEKDHRFLAQDYVRKQEIEEKIKQYELFLTKQGIDPTTIEEEGV